MTDALSAAVDTSALDRLLVRLAHTAPAVGADAGRDAAEAVADRTRGRLPRRTGRLAASVRVETERTDEARMVIGAPYAGWIEYGGTRGRPYVSSGRYAGPSTTGAETVMADSAARGIERALR